MGLVTSREHVNSVVCAVPSRTVTNANRTEKRTCSGTPLPLRVRRLVRSVIIVV